MVKLITKTISSLVSTTIVYFAKNTVNSLGQKDNQGRADLKVENTYILINQSADIDIDNKCEECDKKVKLITTMHHVEKEPM